MHTVYESNMVATAQSSMPISTCSKGVRINKRRCTEIQIVFGIDQKVTAGYGKSPGCIRCILKDQICTVWIRGMAEQLKSGGWPGRRTVQHTGLIKTQTIFTIITYTHNVVLIIRIPICRSFDYLVNWCKILGHSTGCCCSRTLHGNKLLACCSWPQQQCTTSGICFDCTIREASINTKYSVLS